MSHKTLLAFLLSLGVATTTAFADPTLWTGPNTNFSKGNFANPSLAANQDRLTSTTWLTRGSSQGLYDAHDESFFSHFSSPSDTEWADGFLANYASLHYTDWNSWAKGVHAGPPSTIGVQAVVHLKAEDIYFSLKFTSWTASGGGGFSYIRSTPSVVPEPSSSSLLLLALLPLASRRLRRIKR